MFLLYKFFDWPARMSGNTARCSSLSEKDGLRSKELWLERHNCSVSVRKMQEREIYWVNEWKGRFSLSRRMVVRKERKSPAGFSMLTTDYSTVVAKNVGKNNNNNEYYYYCMELV